MYKTELDIVDGVPFLILFNWEEEIVRHVVLNKTQAEFVESYYYLIEQKENVNKNTYPTKKELDDCITYLTKKYLHG